MSLLHWEFYAANVWQRQQIQWLKTEGGKRGLKKGARRTVSHANLRSPRTVDSAATIAPLLRTTAHSGTISLSQTSTSFPGDKGTSGAHPSDLPRKYQPGRP